MAGSTGLDRVVGWIGVTFTALIPYTLVRTAVDREILIIVFGVFSRNPRIFIVTGGTFGREIQRCMGWIVGLIVFIHVTSCTGVRRIVVISVVTSHALISNRGMSSRKHIILIVYVK